MGKTIPLPVGILVLLSLVLFPIACDRVESNAPVSTEAEDTLRFDVPMAFGPVDPFKRKASGTQWFLPLIYNSLATRNEKGRCDPDLARSWQYHSPSNSWHINLRQGVRFHDGSIITADDAIYSIQQALKRSVPHIRGIVDRIEAVNDHSIVLHLTKDHPDPIKKILSTPIVPNKSLLNTNIEHPIGSGPYRLNKRIDKHKILLTAFDDYFNGRPGIPKIIFTHVPTKEQSWSRLLSGKSDITVRVSPENLRLMKFIRNNYQITQKPSWFIKTLLYNTADPLFSDERVRKALDLCIDRRRMVEQILMGHGRVATSPLGVDSPYGSIDREPISYDPIEAQELLASAGWELEDIKGVRYKNGKPFSFTLQYMNENPVNEQVARFIQICFNDLGIKAQIKPVTTEEAIHAYVRNTGFQAVLTETQGTYDELAPIIRTWLPDKNGCSNMACFSSPELTGLLSVLKSSTPKKKKIKICRSIEDKLLELTPASFLFHANEIDVVANRIQLPYEFGSDLSSVHRLYLARIRSSN